MDTIIRATTWFFAGAALALGCSARSSGLPPPTTDVPAADDVPTAPPDAPVTPPDVLGAEPDAPGTPPDAAPPGPDVTTENGCYVEPGGGALCPMVRGANDPSRPSVRVTQIDIRGPAALASPILQNVINTSVRSGGFLWGMTFDGGARSLRTGALMVATRGSAGQGLLDATYRYATSSTGSLERSGTRVTAAVASGTVRLPIYDGTGALLTELPLENLRIGAVLSPDGGCVGAATPTDGRFNECNGRWSTADGQIVAVITASAARDVQVAALNTTLCNLLAGSDCAATPQSRWTRQPDTMANGEPGYTLTANFAAVAATVR